MRRSKEKINKETTEEQQQFQQPTIVHPPPLEPFQDTILLTKPLGVRICKNTLKVTYIEQSGASNGRVFIGDIITAIDGQKISTISDLNSMLKKASSMIAVTFNRICYSKCKLKKTFVEKISVERGHEMKCSGRAIDQYLVQMALHTNDMNDASELLGLSLKYDAKERIQVHSTTAGSLASLHLRPGDVIREVNEYPIASKTMLDYFIQAAIVETGQINFTIECSAGGIDSYRDQIELAADVIEIAQKQILQFRTALATKTLLNRPSILIKQQQNNCNKNDKRIVISKNFIELPIGADFDPSKLRTCKGANVEMRNAQKSGT